MDNQSPAPDSLRKLIHDLNQVIFLMRGHCELAKATDMDSANLGEHLQRMEAHLDDMTALTKELKRKQLKLAPEE
jgi:hypothetical protein